MTVTLTKRADINLTSFLRVAWMKEDVRIDTAVPRPDPTHVVPVKIDVDPRWITRVGRVEFDGNRVMSDATLRRGVVLRPGTTATEATVKELQDFVKSQIAPYKYPRSIEFVPALPRTETGKLQRFRLREATAGPRAGNAE